MSSKSECVSTVEALPEPLALPVKLPDGLLEVLDGMDQELGALLLELYVFQLAGKEESEGRGWSKAQLNAQLEAVQEKLRGARESRGPRECGV